MEQRKLIAFLSVIGQLKSNTRHCWTTSDRQESVAEHSWRAAVMAMLLRDEFPEVNIDRVIRMCLIHDMGEAVTGDIPAFYKTVADETTEAEAVVNLIGMLPPDYVEEFTRLFTEMQAKETPEAKLFKAIDNLEAVLSHNEADLSTWIELEYTKNLTYGAENVAYSAYLTELKRLLNADSRQKIEAGTGKTPLK